MTPLEFLALTLASGAVVDAWRQGSLFSGPRVRVARAAERADGGVVARMLDCWYCLAHWVPAALLAAFFLPGLEWPALRPYLMLPVYALAATRIVVLVNGLVPAALRHEAGEEREDVLPDGAEELRRAVVDD